MGQLGRGEKVNHRISKYNAATLTDLLLLHGRVESVTTKLAKHGTQSPQTCVWSNAYTKTETGLLNYMFTAIGKEQTFDFSREILAGGPCVNQTREINDEFHMMQALLICRRTVKIQDVASMPGNRLERRVKHTRCVM